MILGILQSAYLPWLGFFDQIRQCDLFLIYEDVQFTKKDWRSRNRIKTPQGPLWLSVPVQQKGVLGRKIRDVHIHEDGQWRKKHWRALAKNYAQAPYFAEHAAFFESIYAESWKYLIDLNRAIIDYCLQYLGLKTRVIYSADTDLEQSYLQYCKGFAEPTERIVYLCSHLGAGTFLEGASGRRFIVPEKLKQAGIDLVFHEYEHPVYTQQFAGFAPCLSIVDLLFNHGPHSLEILASGTRSK